MSTTNNQFGLKEVEDLYEYPLVKGIFPYAFAKKNLLVPLQVNQGVLLLAICDPLNLEGINEARQLYGGEIEEIIAPKEAIEEAIERCYRTSESAKLLSSMKENTLENPQEEGEGYDLLRHTATSPAVSMLNAILIEAIEQGASDIHFEPLETGLLIRYRIDGVLQKRHKPPKDTQAQILTRIKVMARLDIAEKRLPQDGRIKLKMGRRHIDFRVSTIPVVYGERIVLRILDKSNVLLGIDKIGMRSEILRTFKKFISFSEGIVLVTGPTGSGKTTTLYSALAQLGTSDVNIMTIEDPVEYKMQGMAQISVNSKIHLTFAAGLRHILRQDPDVIMIGEIRDKETAEIAIQASLTGHLVLSTLHTNDAPSALTRLVDMGIEPYLLSSSIVGVVAQRLVRSICPHCKIEYPATPAEEKGLGFPEGTPLYKGQGCKQCFETGYKGRRGIYELMPVTSPIKRQLIQSPDSALLQKVALEEKMDTLRNDGLFLVKEGITTTAELMRVTRSAEE